MSAPPYRGGFGGRKRRPKDRAKDSWTWSGATPQGSTEERQAMKLAGAAIIHNPSKHAQTPCVQAKIRHADGTTEDVQRYGEPLAAEADGKIVFEDCEPITVTTCEPLTIGRIYLSNDNPAAAWPAQVVVKGTR